jgi:hypothetical protein
MFTAFVAHELVMVVASALSMLSILMNDTEKSATAGVNRVAPDVGEVILQAR